MHGFILFSICAVAVIAQDPLLNDLLDGSDLLKDLIDGKLTGDGAAGTVSAAAVKRTGCPYAAQHGGAGEPCAMGRAALRRKQAQIELQLKNVKYPADIFTCDKTAEWTAAPQAEGISMELLDKGYCKEAYTYGYDGKGQGSQEDCNNVCLGEPDCVYSAFYASGSGHCLRYTGECTLDQSAWYPKQFRTYKKVVPVTAAPVLSNSEDSVYGLLVKEVWAKFDSLGDTADQQDYTGCLLRTAGHDFMDFRWTSDGKATGGSDGCINFDDADNTGIPECLVSFKVAEVYKNWCHKVSLGDFLVIAAEAVMARTAPSYKANSFESGTLAHTFMTRFEFGRPTVSSCEEHVGLMPNPEEGCADLKRVFVDHVFLNAEKSTSWKHTAAISGAHTIGKANLENSGYNGTWTTNPAVFDNSYYLRILDQGWIPQWSVNGNQGKNQWIVSDKGRHAPEVAKQMMLNSDLCLEFDNSRDSVNCDSLILGDKAFNDLPPGTTKNVVNLFCANIRGKGHFLNAKERMCCTWLRPDKMFPNDQWHAADPDDPLAGGNPPLYTEGQNNYHCGVNFTGLADISDARTDCCEFAAEQQGYEGAMTGKGVDCDYRGNTEGPGWNHVMMFAYNETYWLESYADAWNVATTNVMKYVGQNSNTYFTAHNTGNCGCCKETKEYWDTGINKQGYRSLQAYDEGWTECEELKTEDTYDPSFWTARHGGSPTWPMFTIDDPHRDIGSTASMAYPSYPAPSTDVVEKMLFASQEHVINALKAKLEECAAAGQGCDTAWMDDLKYYK